MSQFSQLLERIDRECRRAAAACSSIGHTPRDLEDVLTEGYVAALLGEGRSRRLAARVELLAEHLESENAASEVRRVALEKRTLDQRVRLLRGNLAELHDHLARLRTQSPASG